MMNVQMRVKLNDKGGVVAAGKLVINRQRAEMVACNPKKEIPLAQHLAHGLPALPPPIGVGIKRLEVILADSHLIRVTARPRRHSFAAIIGKDFAQLVSKQGDPRRGTGAAEEIKGEEDETALHSGNWRMELSRKWAQQDSNLQPTRYERAALTVEL